MTLEEPPKDTVKATEMEEKAPEIDNPEQSVDTETVPAPTKKKFSIVRKDSANYEWDDTLIDECLCDQVRAEMDAANSEEPSDGLMDSSGRPTVAFNTATGTGTSMTKLVTLEDIRNSRKCSSKKGIPPQAYRESPIPVKALKSM